MQQRALAGDFPFGVEREERTQSLYAELKRMVEERGLLQPQPLYYAFKVPLTFALFTLGFIALLFIDSLWLRVLDAVFLAFMTVQLAFVGHEAGHRQIFRSPRTNDYLGLFNGFLMGASFSWWKDTHNRHHSKPNQATLDPAVNYSVMAFSQDEALAKTGFKRFMVRHQSLFFIPLLMLYPIFMRYGSALYLIRKKSRYRVLEILFLLFHFPLYFLFLFAVLGPWQAVLFTVVHQLLFGLYLSSVFAPNHMGMPMLKADEEMDFLRQQAVTSRNIKGRPLADFLYGGLNYQIEHHLFPRMAPNKLREAKGIVERFLCEHAISYCETGFFESFQQIFGDLKRASRSTNSPALYPSKM